MSISVFSKGSFHKRTNIPSDSDVDVGILRKDLYFNNYPKETVDSDFNFSTALYTFKEFKTDVERAIINHFGYTEVKSGKKSIKIRSNTSRIDADAVPLFVHRRYNSRILSDFNEGVALRDGNNSIIRN